MRILVVFILLAFGLQGQQTTVNGQQTSCTSDAYTRTVDCCPLTVDYYENQIRKADSLYKNYLPQSNFEEVKAAMEFFDSLRLSKTTDNGQQTFSTEVKQSRALVMHTQGLLTVVRCPLTLAPLKRTTTTLWVSPKKTILLVPASIIL